MEMALSLSLIKQASFSSKLAKWVSLLLLVGCSWSAGTLVWTILEPAGIQNTALPTSNTIEQQPATTVSNKQAGLDSVAQLHLFGTVQKANASQAIVPVVTNAPETRLSLTLKGIVSNTAGQSALALIAEGKGMEKVYKIGMTIANQAKIHAINPDHVVLDRNGNLEILKLPKNEVDANSITNRSSSRGVGAFSSKRNLDTSQRVSTTKYGEIREKLLSNPQEVMKMARVRPVMKSGRMTGYRVDPGSDPKLFSEVGLVAGDVVTTVNGVSVTNPAEMGNVLNQLTTASQIEVTILRNGVEQSLSLSF
jgi:general secretion pathway protein C